MKSQYIVPIEVKMRIAEDRAQLLRNSAEGQYIGTKGNAHGSPISNISLPTVAPLGQNENCWPIGVSSSLTVTVPPRCAIAFQKNNYIIPVCN
jgi:hypothetical protein